VVELLGKFDAEYDFVGNDGPNFYFVTNLNAPMSRVVSININHPEPAAWREIVPESRDILRSAGMVGDCIIAQYLHDATSRVAVFDGQGAHRYDVKLPGLGTAAGFNGRVGDRETFYSYTSYDTPSESFRLDLATGQSTLLRRDPVKFDSSHFVTEQVFYPSKDGSRVPMFLVHRKGIAMDGNNPTYLY